MKLRSAICASMCVSMCVISLLICPGALPGFPDHQARAATTTPDYKALSREGEELLRAGKYKTSLRHSLQALSLMEKKYGLNHEDIARQAFIIGQIYRKLNRLEEAISILERSVSVYDKAHGPEGYSTTLAVEELGHAYRQHGRLLEAEAAYNRVLKQRKKGLVRDNFYVAPTYGDLASIAYARGEWEKALQGYRRMSRLMTNQKPNNNSSALPEFYFEQQVDRSRPAFIGIANSAWQAAGKQQAKRSALAGVSFEASQWAWRTSASAALNKMASRLGTSNTKLGRSIRKIQDLKERQRTIAERMDVLMKKTAKAYQADDIYMGLLKKMEALQREKSKIVEPAAARRAAIEKEIKALGRNRETANKRKMLQREDKALLRKIIAIDRKFGAPNGPMMKILDQTTRRSARIVDPGVQVERARLGQQTGALYMKLLPAENRIKKQFPEYIELANPKPLTMKSVQSLLKRDEALVAFMPGEKNTFVWAISKTTADWARIDLGAAAISQIVTALRRGLDPSVKSRADKNSTGEGPPFNLHQAHDFYRNLLGPVEHIFKDKPNLLIVPSGALTSLPFHVLVTKRAKLALPGFEGYRKADWLMKRHAYAVLPSVPSLRALRKFSKRKRAKCPFIGFGDPVLEGAGPAQTPNDAARGKRANAGDFSSFFRGKLADVTRVKRLAPLPATAIELQFVARTLGAPGSSIKLRAAATESAVKKEKIDRYRVVHFATHGLVTGDIKGLGEPALVLTPPDIATPDDDGLLMASEIAALKLNADWVVLSACNTASGDKPGAEGLSGLARAFFYAGARSLLVSNWPVYSKAAVKLTTQAFLEIESKRRKRSPIGRAEALRRSMLALVEKGKPFEAHPTYWAPFILVGEGM